MKFKVGDKVKATKDIGCSEGSIPKGSICTVLEVSDCICKVLDCAGRQWTSVIDSFELTAPIISEIKEKKLSCVIHTKTKNEATMLVKLLGVNKNYILDPTDAYIDFWEQNEENTCYRINNGKVSEASNCQICAYKGETIYDFSDLFATGGVVSIHDLPISEWYRPMRIKFKNGSSIEALPKETNAVRGNGCLNPPEFVFDAKQAEELAERLNKELSGRFNAFANNGISAKNGGKNSMKFTFYVKEGTRVDKTCNKLIPTMTTFITAECYGDSTYHGAATCDKADYDERQGCLEAIANAVLGGNFDRDFNRAVKANELADKKKRTCTYCGQLFDTVEEKQVHEAWHVERKKARRERYLLRKRAKEIAFEEQAQKLAKEMVEK